MLLAVGFANTCAAHRRILYTLLNISLTGNGKRKPRELLNTAEVKTAWKAIWSGITEAHCPTLSRASEHSRKSNDAETEGFRSHPYSGGGKKRVDMAEPNNYYNTFRG